MGIRFSPGCECCENIYLAVCQGVQLPIMPGQTYKGYSGFGITVVNTGLAASVGSGGAVFIDPAVWGVIGFDRQLDLVTDASGINQLATFQNTNILPILPNNRVPNPFGKFCTDFNLPPSSQIKFAASVPVTLNATFAFYFFQLEGSSPNWRVTRSLTAVENTVGNTGVAQHIFSIGADGNII